MTPISAAVAGHDVLICVGSGGVGKTTVAAALALRAAVDGKGSLVCTIDPARRLANALGLEALGNSETPIPPMAFEEVGLARIRLEQRHLTLRQCRRQRNSGRATARSDVDDRPLEATHDVDSPQGILDAAVLAATSDPAGILSIYFEQGHVFRELGKSGQKFRYDNASTVYSNIMRVVASDFQETRNMENTGPILPNTRTYTATVVVG